MKYNWKQWENNYFDQHLGAQAPERCSKYTPALAFEFSVQYFWCIFMSLKLWGSNDEVAISTFFVEARPLLAKFWPQAAQPKLNLCSFSTPTAAAAAAEIFIKFLSINMLIILKLCQIKLILLTLIRPALIGYISLYFGL